MNLTHQNIYSAYTYCCFPFRPTPYNESLLFLQFGKMWTTRLRVLCFTRNQYWMHAVATRSVVTCFFIVCGDLYKRCGLADMYILYFDSVGCKEQVYQISALPPSYEDAVQITQYTLLSTRTLNISLA